MEYVSAILGFLKLLPELVALVKAARNLVGDNADKFLADLARAADLHAKSMAESVTIEQKRELRREALRLGLGAFGRID